MHISYHTEIRECGLLEHDLDKVKANDGSMSLAFCVRGLKMGYKYNIALSFIGSYLRVGSNSIANDCQSKANTQCLWVQFSEGKTFVDAWKRMAEDQKQL